MKIIVSGGAGFMGSAFVRLLVKKGLKPIVIDKLTYAGDLKRLDKLRLKIYKVDIRKKNFINDIFKKEKPDIVVNFSAESHVDKSIKDPTPFLETNIKGTKVLLDASKECKVKYIHISSDEVYGEAPIGAFKEDSPLNPSNPYSASKASADFLIKSYQRTYGFKSIIIRPCNNYGHYQHKEKFIPGSIVRVLNGEKIHLHGNGQAMREWIYVDDCAYGVYLVMRKGIQGEIYNLGSGFETKNICVAREILKNMDKGSYFIEFVKERPGQDRRYFLDSSKIRRLGFCPKMPFGLGIKKTVEFFS